MHRAAHSSSQALGGEKLQVITPHVKPGGAHGESALLSTSHGVTTPCRRVSPLCLAFTATSSMRATSGRDGGSTRAELTAGMGVRDRAERSCRN